MSDPLRELQILREGLDDIQAAIADVEPELWEEYRELESRLPKVEKAAKVEARKLGAGKHEVHGIDVTVGATRLKAAVDLEALLEEAQSRGDVELLLRMGVLEYTAAAHQILRLPAELQRIYKEFVRTTPRTPTVKFK